MQSDPSVYRYLRRLRGTGIGNLIEGGTGKCTLLTEESRYGVVGQVRQNDFIDQEPPPRPLRNRKLRDILLMSRPPLLARRGDMLSPTFPEP
jgi:hypothetical protein